MPNNALNINLQQNYLILTTYLVPFFISAGMVLTLHLRKDKSKSLRVLEILLLSLNGTVLLYMLKFFFFYSLSHYPVLQLFNQLYALATAPLIYFYFIALLRPGKLSLRMASWHFIPLLVGSIAVMLLFLSGNTPEPYYSLAAVWRDIAVPANMMRVSIFTAYTFIRLGYIVAILVMLHSYHQSIKSQFSYTEGINLKWAYWALLAVLLSSYAPIMVSAFHEIRPLLQVIFASIATIYVLLLFFAAYHQPTLYADENKEGYSTEGEKLLSRLSGGSRERLKNDLVDLFENKKRFQDPTLSIDDVAKDLNTNRTYVSKIINEEFGSSFYAFVNKYRMTEFVNRLYESKENAPFRIREVSEQVGFKSYTSFFNYFREEMGTTPSDYLKHNRDSNENT